MNPYPSFFEFVEFVIQNPTLIFILGVWSLIWKGLALWRSAQKKEKVWFIVLLILNTLGLLEILYLFVFSKKEPSKKGLKDTEKEEENI